MIGVAYRILPDEQLPEEKVEHIITHDDTRALLENYDQQVGALVSQLESKEPELAEIFNLFNKKLD